MRSTQTKTRHLALSKPRCRADELFSAADFLFFPLGGLESTLSAGSGCSKRSHASHAGGGGAAEMDVSTTYCSQG